MLFVSISFTLGSQHNAFWGGIWALEIQNEFSLNTSVIYIYMDWTSSHLSYLTFERNKDVTFPKKHSIKELN